MKPIGAKDQISEFYSALSACLDAVLNDSRWVSSGPYPALERRIEDIRGLLDSLQAIGVADDIIRRIKADADQTLLLAGFLYSSYSVYGSEPHLIEENREAIKYRQAYLDRVAETWADLVDSDEVPAEPTTRIEVIDVGKRAKTQ